MADRSWGERERKTSCKILAISTNSVAPHLAFFKTLGTRHHVIYVIFMAAEAGLDTFGYCHIAMPMPYMPENSHV